MKRDIDRIIEHVSERRTDIAISQLQVSHEADDDGLWFFRREGGRYEVQLESKSGNCPFLVESSRDDARHTARTVDEAVTLILTLLDG